MSLNRVIETGTYVGNGTTQTITIGWQAGSLFVCSSRSAGGPSQRGIGFKFGDPSVISGPNYTRIQSTSAIGLNGITVTTTGFTVGSNDAVNRNGEIYHYAAIRNGPHLDNNTYTGTGTPKLFPLGRTPCAVFFSNQSGNPDTSIVLKHRDYPSDEVWAFTTSGGQHVSCVLGNSLAIDGFMNQAGQVYLLTSLYDLVGSTRHFEVGTYTSTGAGAVVTLGRQPKLLFLQGANGLIFKTDTMGGGAMGQVSSTYSWVQSGGLTLNSTGFTVIAGTPSDNTGTNYYLAGYV